MGKPRLLAGWSDLRLRELPAFAGIAAAVMDIGGIMSHAAIVAREYGLPAVLGTGTGTRAIKTGDRVRVDGDAGLVTILGS